MQSRGMHQEQGHVFDSGLKMEENSMPLFQHSANHSAFPEIIYPDLHLDSNCR